MKHLSTCETYVNAPKPQIVLVEEASYLPTNDPLLAVKLDRTCQKKNKKEIEEKKLVKLQMGKDPLGDHHQQIPLDEDSEDIAAKPTTIAVVVMRDDFKLASREVSSHHSC